MHPPAPPAGPAPLHGEGPGHGTISHPLRTPHTTHTRTTPTRHCNPLPITRSQPTQHGRPAPRSDSGNGVTSPRRRAPKPAVDQGAVIRIGQDQQGQRHTVQRVASIGASPPPALSICQSILARFCPRRSATYAPWRSHFVDMFANHGGWLVGLGCARFRFRGLAAWHAGMQAIPVRGRVLRGGEEEGGLLMLDGGTKSEEGWCPGLLCPLLYFVSGLVR